MRLLPIEKFRERLEQIILISCANPFHKELEPSFGLDINPSDIDWAYILELAKVNKILPSVFKRIGQLPHGVNEKINNLTIKKERRMRSRNESLLRICRLFNDQNIKYVIIKSLRKYSFFDFTDHDFLIPDKSDEKRALKILRKLGYIFEKTRIFFDPYKFICVKESSQIDIYPKVAWNNIKVEDGNFLVMRRRRKDYENSVVYVPPVEEELLIDSSHTFVHGVITLADAFEGMICLVEDKIDWAYIIKRAAKNCVILHLYCFLTVLDRIHSLIYASSIVPNQVFKLLLNHKIVKITRHLWKGNFGGNKEFIPYRFPFILILTSAFYRELWNLKHGNLTGFLDDLKGHFLMIGCYFLDRLGIKLGFLTIRPVSEIDKL